MIFDPIKYRFEKCINESGIFEKDTSDYLEADIIRKENQEWFVLAKGIDEDYANEFFCGNDKKAERAKSYLRIFKGGNASLFFMVRLPDPTRQNFDPRHPVAQFSIEDDIPILLIRQAFIKITDLPDNESNIIDLRWDLDIYNALEEPHEKWLTSWSKLLHYNPAHAISHLHINPKQIRDGDRDRDRHDELRLAIGIPNPLALILSIASWLRAQ